MIRQPPRITTCTILFAARARNHNPNPAPAGRCRRCVPAGHSAVAAIGRIPSSASVGGGEILMSQPQRRASAGAFRSRSLRLLSEDPRTLARNPPAPSAAVTSTVTIETTINITSSSNDGSRRYRWPRPRRSVQGTAHPAPRKCATLQVACDDCDHRTHDAGRGPCRWRARARTGAVVALWKSIPGGETRPG